MVDRAEGRAELLEMLVEGISVLTTSESWRRYLECQSRFHRYSFGNVLLIAAQRPDATRVAGFRSWKKLGRSVARGEKAIWILAPIIERRRSGDEVADRVVRGFRQVPVFDISQTRGDELPAVCRGLVGDGPLGCYDQLAAVARSIGYSVEEAELPEGVNGDCAFDSARIRIECRNPTAQRVKSLAHEIAHALLHEHQTDRRVAELEAESTAFVVCRALGIDSSDYSFGYVAAWAGGGENAAVGIRSAGERIQRASAAMLARFEADRASMAA